MTDDFESAVQRVARKKNGDAVTPDLFWDIVLALDKDLGASDKAGRRRHEETVDLIASHIADDKTRADTIATELATWQTAQAKRCAEEHAKLFARQPRREGDPPSVDYSRDHDRIVTLEEDAEIGDMRRVWRVARWGVAAFVLPIIAAAGYRVALIIFGG